MSRSSAETAAAAAPKPLRCAIYTRKSSEEGLDQAFNSLHAQREAAEAYILSQTHEGWVALPTIYDDGGFSGGSMDRPALKALLGDVQAGKIDVIIIYKIDRLTRSLMDFSRIVEILDDKGVSFVSVTQAFNTTNSMGRLMLNVLLSFAQFEREITGERIRDKIKASKQKGMWMGGNVLLGYDLKDRQLLVNTEEADLVRSIFRRYLELGSVRRLQATLEAEGVRSKRWISSSGAERGGYVLGRGALYHLLSNRHYIGEIVHKTEAYPGRHAAIIDRDTFDKVQASLVTQAGRPRGQPSSKRDLRLTGRIYDADGERMIPTVSKGRGERAYAYYVSATTQAGTAASDPCDAAPRRLPARMLEAHVLALLRRLVGQPEADWPDLSPALIRIDAGATSTDMVLDIQTLAGRRAPDAALADLYRRLAPGEDAVRDSADPNQLRVRLPYRLQFRGGRRGVVEGSSPAPVDITLVKALTSAHKTLSEHKASPLLPIAGLAKATAPDSYYLRRLTQMAFLAPDLQQAILDGREPKRLTVKTFFDQDLPLAWSEQRRWWRSLT